MRLSLIALAAAAATACAPRTERSSAAASDPCAGSPAGEVGVVAAFLRPAAAGQATSALYFTICNRGAAGDALIAVRSSLADAIEIHETTKSDAGVASMAPLARLDVAAGAATALAPGGRHVMLIGLRGPIAVGAEERFTLIFEKAGEIEVTAIARAVAEEPSAHEH